MVKLAPGLGSVQRATAATGALDADRAANGEAPAAGRFLQPIGASAQTAISAHEATHARSVRPELQSIVGRRMMPRSNGVCQRMPKRELTKPYEPNPALRAI